MVRLDINTSGSWRILIREIPEAQRHQVMAACETLVNAAAPKSVAFQLVAPGAPTPYRLETLRRRDDAPAAWTWRPDR